MSEQNVLIKVDHLQKYFPIKKKSIFQREQRYVKANKDLSFQIYEGETFGLVGESGCGKSTLGRTMIQLYQQTGGNTFYYGKTLEDVYPEYVRNILKDYTKLTTALLKDQTTYATLISSDDTTRAITTIDRKLANVVRLFGGLVLYSNHKEIASLLQHKYTLGHSLVKKKNEKTQAALAEVESKLDTIRTSLQENSDFQALERYCDSGIDLLSLNTEEMRKLRRDLQIIFQDPYSSLNPRLTVGQIISEGIVAHKLFDKKDEKALNAYIVDIMEKCGLPAAYIHRYPHQFSGGQRQRIGIARALALDPRFIVCDEAVSALDVSIQEQILKLLYSLKEENNLTYLFITHDLGVVRYISDRIGVMYFGNLVELAPAEEIFDNPIHPYTKALLAAIPRIDFEQNREKYLNTEHDYPFDFTYLETREADKDWVEVTPGHFVACKLREENNA